MLALAMASASWACIVHTMPTLTVDSPRVLADGQVAVHGYDWQPGRIRISLWDQSTERYFLGDVQPDGDGKFSATFALGGVPVGSYNLWAWQSPETAGYQTAVPIEIFSPQPASPPTPGGASQPPPPVVTPATATPVSAAGAPAAAQAPAPAPPAVVGSSPSVLGSPGPPSNATGSAPEPGQIPSPGALVGVPLAQPPVAAPLAPVPAVLPADLAAVPFGPAAAPSLWSNTPGTALPGAAGPEIRLSTSKNSSRTGGDGNGMWPWLVGGAGAAGVALGAFRWRAARRRG